MIRAVESSLVVLIILTSPSVPKQLYLEEVIDRVISLTKFQLKNNIFPEFDPLYRESDPNGNKKLYSLSILKMSKLFNFYIFLLLIIFCWLMCRLAVYFSGKNQIILCISLLHVHPCLIILLLNLTAMCSQKCNGNIMFASFIILLNYLLCVQTCILPSREHSYDVQSQKSKVFSAKAQVDVAVL